MSLDAVGTGFVERVHFRMVVADDGVRQRLEGDMRDHMKIPHHTAIAGEHDAGADFVRPAGESANHPKSLLHVRRLCQWLAIHIDERIRAEHEMAWTQVGSRESLSPGIFHRELFGRQ